MTKLRLLAFSVTLCLLAPTVHAYDEDTHFYGTYSMARFAGLSAPVAEKIALTTQWMDECYLSDPTSMILMPFDGIKKRRLLHFPSTRVSNKIAVSIQNEGFGFKTNSIQQKIAAALSEKYKLDLSKLLVHTTTIPNHPFASELLREGMREGNLMKAAASLHVIEDSYAHAGTSAEVGHTFFWHWPDRPYENAKTIEKYFMMTNTVFQALVAIREQLPTEALDCSLKTNGRSNCEMSSQDLHDAYSSNPLVVKTVSADILKSREYIEPTLRDFIKRAVSVGYLKAGVDYDSVLDQILNKNAFFIDNGDPAHAMDTYGVLQRFLDALFVKQQGKIDGDYLNLDQLPRDMGMISDPLIRIDQYIASLGGLDQFSETIVQSFLVGYVPVPLSVIHREEAEDDAAPTRPLEMELRNQHMQNLIQQMYGDRIQFVGNNTKDDKGFGQEVTLNKSAEPVVHVTDPSVTYATFTLAEKNSFDHMIFNYLFPSMGDDALKVITEFMIVVKRGAGGLNVDPQLTVQPQSAMQHFWGLVHWIKSWFVAIDDVNRFLGHMNGYVDALAKDLATSHMVLNGDEKYYQNLPLLNEYKVQRRELEKNPDLYPKFLGPHDVWTSTNLKINNNNQPWKMVL